MSDKKKGKIWYVLFGIGYLALWFRFFMPNEWGKGRNVSRTGRQMRYKHIWGPLNAIAIYGVLIWLYMNGNLDSLIESIIN
tara:strand:- start:1478 stop:1720 length:243 start_codon:yes stop_codon:yes gene_type:complete